MAGSAGRLELLQERSNNKHNNGQILLSFLFGLVAALMSVHILTWFILTSNVVGT